MGKAIRRGKRINEKRAKALLAMLARCGNIFDAEISTAADDIRGYCLRRGIDYQHMIERARTYGEQIPHLENLVGSVWTSEGAKISRVYQDTGEEEILVEGDGQYSEAYYWTAFEQAVGHLNQMIEKQAMFELHSAIERGVASVEAYISHRAHHWNRLNKDKSLHDNESEKVRLEDKLRNWVPIMSGGRRIDLGSRSWQNFAQLKSIRDKSVIHPNRSSFGMSIVEMASIANLFKSGIAESLVELHLLFQERIPAIIIKESFAPDFLVD